VCWGEVKNQPRIRLFVGEKEKKPIRGMGVFFYKKGKSELPQKGRDLKEKTEKAY